MNKKEEKTNHGITLIALIITIVVITILASISISMSLSKNGLFNRVKFAKQQYLNSEESEQDILKSYLTIMNGDNQIVSSSREEPWNGATMLTISISNITGGTFTINVNNVEAANYKKLYYYVNDKMVYSGTDTSFQVNQLEGKPITDKTTYDVKVLSEPFSIKVTTGEGDNIDAWLACIGNPNQEKYTTENLSELFKNESLVDNLFSSQTAIDYLFKSKEKILPYIFYKDNISFFSNKMTSNSIMFAHICENEEYLSYCLKNDQFRLKMYENHNITEPILEASTTAIETMKKSSNYEVISKTMTLTYQSFYEGKSFVIGSSQLWDYDTRCWVTLDNFVGNTATVQYRFDQGYGTTGLVVPICKFAENVRLKQSYDNSHTGYIALFKID